MLLVEWTMVRSAPWENGRRTTERELRSVLQLGRVVG